MSRKVPIELIDDNAKVSYRPKYLLSDVSLNQTITDLGYDGLVIGQLYQVQLTPWFQVDNGNATITVNHNGAVVLRCLDRTNSIDGSQNTTMSIPFIATATTLTVVSSEMDTTDTIFGDGTASQTHIVLYKLSNYIEDLTL